MATRRVAAGDVQLVVGSPLSPAEQAALEVLQNRARALCGAAFPVVEAASWSGSAGTAVLLSADGSNSTADRVRRTWGIEAPFRGLPPGRAAQGYVLTYGQWDGHPLLLATGSSPAGSAHAIADLACHLTADEQGAAFLLAGYENGNGRLMRREAPAVQERGVYLNIASPLPPLTVHEWDEQQWSVYLDQLLLARLNRLYFYLWMDLLSDHSPAPEWRAPNRRLHERLRWMIPQAQRRGIQVTVLFCPTFLPRELWLAHPELHAQIDYVDHGFPCICPSRPAAWPVMLSVYRHELEWFRAADGFQLWFYDPGGCLCEECSQDLAGPLLRQVEIFRKLVHDLNPAAEFQVSLWPIWQWEIRLSRRYGLDFLDRLADLLGPDRGRTAIVDTAEADIAFLSPARDRGFRTQAFMFSTNVETPFVFLNPQISYLRQVSARIIAGRFTGGFCHRLQPGSKLLNTLLVARLLWDPDLSPSELVGDAALQLTAHRSAAEHLIGPLLAWDRLLYEGRAAAEAGAGLHESVQQALALLPPTRRSLLEDLATSAQAIEILGQAAAAQDDPERQAALAATLREALAGSPTFRNAAVLAEVEFARLVRWVAQGWKREHF